MRPNFHERSALTSDFDAIRISLASPDKIMSWSHGEVTKPETINYRTFKPERDGLFCAKIFGPITDWECLCGKYKRMKHRGVICDKCGVEVTQAKVRRERLGHITLATPVSHVWFFKGLPSRIGHLLDISLRDLERVLYFEAYVVIDPGDTDLKQNQLLNEEQYRKAKEEHSDPRSGMPRFKAQMGAEAIKELLRRVNVDRLSIELREKMKTEQSVQKKLKYAKRLKVADSFRKSSNRPEWMILDVIPVIPPELRPLVPLDGGRFATSDLNDLYRRVINRNNRLKKLIELKAPDVIIRNEKRMLQEAVDALFDNGRRGRVLRGANNRPLKSLSDTLKGKQGRFRQNLLGKRVDYSGRSVIVVGPELKLHQCGLPKKMALELFKPFIYNKLEERGLVATIKQAKEMVELQRPEVWDVLEEVIREHPVLLNRAPTLHRLGIQAFEPVLVEGKAIRIHPLVCTAFNADFDGDQMAVHIPLSPEAQIEASVLMLSSNNILSPAHGAPIAIPSQDIVLGCYYLTKAKSGAKGEGRAFGNPDDVMLAVEAGELETLSPIRLRYTGDLQDLTASRDDQDVLRTEVQTVKNKIINTTVGRVILNQALPKEMPFVNGLLKKKGLQQLVQSCYLKFGLEKTVEMLDSLKNVGFTYATKSGPVDRHRRPDHPEREEAARREGARRGDQGRIAVSRRRHHQRRALQQGDRDLVGSDRRHRERDVQRDGGDRQGRPAVQPGLHHGRLRRARIEAADPSAGRHARTDGEAVGRNHRDADHGELPRRPRGAALLHLDARRAQGSGRHGAQDGRLGLPHAPSRRRGAGRDHPRARLRHGGRHRSARDRRIGRDHRAAPRPHHRPRDAREDHRPVHGPDDRRRQRRDGRGDVVGHSGRRHREGEDPLGADVRVAPRRVREVLRPRPGHRQDGGARSGGRRHRRAVDRRAGHAADDANVPHRRHGVASVRAVDARSAQRRHGPLPGPAGRAGEGRQPRRHEPQRFARRAGREGPRPRALSDRLRRAAEGEGRPARSSRARCSSSGIRIRSRSSPRKPGQIRFKDILEGITVHEEVDEVTGLSRLIIVDSPDEKKQPAVEIKSAKDGKVNRKYHMPVHAHMMVQDGENVSAGDVLAKIPRETTKTKDITGGLPRVVELFEARKPRETAVISEIDGIVKHGGIVKGQRKIIIVPDEPGAEPREYALPRGVHVNVQEGERVRAGEPLMDGPSNPHDILNVLGEKALQAYLVNEIQEVYRLQGVNINDKHIETIARQMMRWVKIEDVGDTEFLVDEQTDKFRFLEENERVITAGGRPAQGRPLLLGITKASLSTDSFISAASFQETTRVLTEASISGKVDHLRGLKENVTMGRLIPAGTGFEYYRHVQIPPDEPPPPPAPPQPSDDELELERDMEYFVEPEEALGPRIGEPDTGA